MLLLCSPGICWIFAPPLVLIPFGLMGSVIDADSSTTGFKNWAYMKKARHRAIMNAIIIRFLNSTDFISPIKRSRPGIALFSIFFKFFCAFFNFSLYACICDADIFPIPNIVSDIAIVRSNFEPSLSRPFNFPVWSAPFPTEL